MPRARRLLTPLAEFLRTEAAGGAVLLLATVVALVWANVAPASYTQVWDHGLTIGLGALSETLDIRQWVNEGLMAAFFFVVGLEIKREVVHGELRDPRRAALPAIAALGGMAVPALIYATLNSGTHGASGWGIPMATDIAFALGVLALIGRRVPSALKVLLLTLAIVDDVGAIAVIALFYSHGLAPVWLLGAAAGIVLVVTMARRGVVGPWWYVLPALAIWACTLESGIHATIAGVALGLLTPTRDARGGSPIERLEHALHPWTSYVVIPLFALANAGMTLGGTALRGAWTSRITWGVIGGLVLGKVLGIGLATLAALRTSMARLPPGVRARHVVGLGLLGGIGFTVSLFVADLSFTGPVPLDEAKLGILVASLASGLVGAAVLVLGNARAQTSGHGTE